MHARRLMGLNLVAGLILVSELSSGLSGGHVSHHTARG